MMRKTKLFLLFCILLLSQLAVLHFVPIANADGEEYDFIDNNTSDVDSHANHGTQSNFTTQQYSDLINDTLTEANTNTTKLNESENFVDNDSSDVDSHADHGTSSNFTAQQDSNVLYNDTLTEADTGGSKIQVEYVDAGTGAAGTTTTITPAYPASPDSGDLFLMQIMVLGTAVSVTSVTGFTSLLGPYTSGTDGRIWIYYRYSDGTETGTTTVTTGTGTVGRFARIYSFRYVHQTIGSAYEAVNWVDEGSVSTVLDRGVTTTGPLELALNFVNVGEDANTYVSFTGETVGDWIEVVAQYSNGAGNDGTLQLQCATMASAATVDGGSFAMGAADPVGVLGLALIPATPANYELDLEFQWTTADFDETNEYLCINTGTLDAEALKVDVWTGSWTNIISSLNVSQWNNVSIGTYLTDTTITFRFLGGTETGDTSQSTWQIECNLIHVWSVGVNYELDIEEQFTNCNYSRPNEILCIFAGTWTTSETLRVDAWNTSSNAWVTVIASLTANQWNNVSVSSLLTSSTFTIRFVDGTNSGDTVQSSWSKDCCLLHTWNELPSNGSPSTSWDDTNNCYAQKKYYEINITYTDIDGFADFNYVEMSFKQEAALRATFRYFEDNNSVLLASGSNNWDLNTSNSLFTESGNTIVARWQFMAHWDATEESAVDIELYCVDTIGASDNDTIADNFDVVTRLVTDGLTSDDGRINIGGTTTISGTVYYANNPGSNVASTSYPPNAEFTSVSIHDSVHSVQATNNTVVNGAFSVNFAIPSAVQNNTYHVYIDMADADYTDADAVDSDTTSVIGDRIDIYWTQVDDDRRDYGSTGEVRFKAVLSYDQTGLGSGDSLSVNASAMTWDATNSWFEKTYTYSAVVKYAFSITAGSQASYGITAINQNVSSLTITWDRIEIYEKDDPIIVNEIWQTQNRDQQVIPTYVLFYPLLVYAVLLFLAIKNKKKAKAFTFILLLSFLVVIVPDVTTVFASDETVTVNTYVIIWFRARYDYDKVTYSDSSGSTLSINATSATYNSTAGALYWYRNVTQSTPGEYVYTVTAISDGVYGLTTFNNIIGYITITFTDPPPTYSNVGTNSTLAGQPCEFYTLWNDNTNVSGFIFGTNNTGSWTNDTWVAFSAFYNSTAAWSNVTKTLNSTINVVIQWQIWCNDTGNNWNNTGIQTFATTLAYKLNLRVMDWDLTDAIANAYVTMNNETDHVQVSDSNGWANYTGLSGTVTVKVQYFGFWVNGTFSVTMDSDKTINVRCKLYDVTVLVQESVQNAYLASANVTVYNSTSVQGNKITSGVTGNNGQVQLLNLPNNTLTFTQYGDASYSLVIGNTTRLVSSENQTITLTGDQNSVNTNNNYSIIAFVGMAIPLKGSFITKRLKKKMQKRSETNEGSPEEVLS